VTTSAPLYILPDYPSVMTTDQDPDCLDVRGFRSGANNRCRRKPGTAIHESRISAPPIPMSSLLCWPKSAIIVAVAPVIAKAARPEDCMTSIW